MATRTWDSGAATDFWNLADNWDTNVLPSSGDDIVIAAGFGTTIFNGSSPLTSLTIAGLDSGSNLTVSGGVLTVSGAADFGQNLSISAGTLELNGSSSINTFTQSNGSLSGTGTVTITGASTITFGDHRGTGTTIFQGPTTISSGGLRLDGGRTLRNLNTLTWSAGTLLFNNNVSGTAILGSGTIDNVAGATFIASGNSANSIDASNFSVSDNGTDAVFNNAGTFRKSGSSAIHITTVGVAFNNSGTVDVETGSLNLSGGGTHTGNFTGSTGIINFAGGTHLLQAGSSITTQNANFSGSGTTTINGIYNVAGSTGVSGGSTSINGTLTSLGSSLNIFGGLLNLNASNASVTSLTQIGGSLAGTGNFTVTGASTITSGDHRGTGTTILQGPTAIGSSGFRLDGGRVLRNENTLTWTAGQINLNNNVNSSAIPGSGTINNIVGATFVASGDSASSINASNFGVNDNGSDALFTNAGTFRKSGSTAGNTTTVDVAFNNAGTVDVLTGILNLANGGTHSGSFTGTAGTIGFGGGTHQVNAGSTITTQNVRFSGSGTTTINGTYNVAGSTSISGGTATINGTLTSLGSALNISSGLLDIQGSNASVGTLTQSNGGLAGTGNLTVTGATTITFGDHRGTGTTILQGPTSISSSGFRLDGGRTMRNENTLTWSAGTLLFNNNVNGTAIPGSGTINNIAGATFIASGDSASSITASNFSVSDNGSDALFTNAGTFRKSGSTANHITTVDVAFNNTGTVDVLTGILNLTNGGTHTGNFAVAAGTVLGFGGGIHQLNAGTITAPGTVRLTGSTTVNVNTTYAIAGTTNLQGGVLTLAGANASTGTLTQSGGGLAGTGNFTVTGAATITFGDHRGTGTTVLQGPTSISASGLRLDGGRTLRNENTLTWSDGQLQLNNNVNGTSIPGSGSINNATGATFIASGDGASSIAATTFGVNDNGSDALFTNAGTFRKSGSTAGHTTSVDVAFNNAGTVDVDSGILNLTNGGTHTGSFDIAAGTVLGFGGGIHQLNAGTITSPGTVRVSGSTTVNVNTAYAIAGTTNLQGGVLSLAGANASTGALTQSGGSLAGTGNFTVTGTATITSGDHRGTGTTILQGPTSVSNLRLDGGRTLRNENTLTWSAGQFILNNNINGTALPGSATIENITGATFIASGDSPNNIFASNFGVNDNGTDALFTNAGTFRKSGSTANATTSVEVAFNNTGTVDVDTGILNLNNNGTHSGTFDIAADAVLGFGGGNHNLNGGSTTGNGTLRLSGAVAVNVANPYTVASGFSMTNGTVLGADLTLSGPASFTFGSHVGGGTTILQGASTISSSGLRLDGGRTLRNENTLTWSGGAITFNNNNFGTSIAGSATINNVAGATFIASGDLATTINVSNFGANDNGADALFTNAGIFRKSGSTAGNTTSVDVAFTNTGLVEVASGNLNFSNFTQTAGETRLTGGRLLSANNINITGGILSGQGTIDINNFGIDTLNLDNSTITPGAGSNDYETLTIEGNLQGSGDSVVDIEIGSLTEFDVLNIINAANFIAGDRINITRGSGFTANAGDSFRILTYGSGPADLASRLQFSNLVISPTLSFQPIFNTNDVTLQVVQTAAPGSFSINDASVTEGNGGTRTIVFTVSLDNAVAGGASVSYATANGTATAGLDYVATSGTLNFSGFAGETQTVSVTVTGDSLVELNESLFVNLSNPTNGALIADGQGVGTITNDDAAVLNIFSALQSEGDSGTTEFLFNVTLTSAVDAPLSVDFTTNNNSATVADNDYQPASGTLNFNGTAGETRQISVNVVGDTKVEANENFFVNLSNLQAGGRNVSLGTSQAVGTIVNDDVAALPVVTLAVSPASVLEDGVANLVYTFTRTGATTNALTVNYTVGGTATNGSDYGLIPASVVFAAGSATATVTVDPTGDTVLEPNETVSLTLVADPAYTIGTAGAVTGTISNDDAASFSISDVTLTEGNSGTTNAVFTVTLSNAVAGGASVNFATANGTATAGSDYVATSGTLAFTGTAGETQTVSVTINGDTGFEPNETFFLNLSAPTNGVTLLDGQGLGTITNDDAAPLPVVTLAVSPASVTENGVANLIYTFTRTGATTDPLTVNYAINGSATNGSDYGLIGSSVVFAAGSATATVTVDPTGDTVLEPNETVSLTLVADPAYSIGTAGAVTGTISNDDAAAFSISDVSIVEGDSGTSLAVFTVTLSNAVAGGASVNFATSNNTATAGSDYVATAGTLNFAGTTGETQTVSVTLNGDTVVEPNESFFLNLSAPTNGVTLADPQGTGTILNDDAAALPVISLALAPASVLENGAANLVYTFTRTGATTNPLTVNYSIGGTATNGSDYGLIPASVAFAAGSATATVTVDPIGDSILEPDETVSLTLSADPAYLIGTPGAVIGTITNDDAASFSINDVSIVEGNSGTTTAVFTVTLSNAVAGGASVAYATANGTASAGSDYTDTSGTLNFTGNAGEQRTVSVTINGDTEVEPNESFFLNLSAPTNGVTLADGQGRGTISNDDIPPQPAGTPVLFFSAVTAANGRELWLTDGTEAGTRQVIDATPGPAGAFPSTVQLANGKLLFASDDAAGDTELWVTDGTTAGTSQLVEINPIVSFSSAIAPTFITPFDGGALFFADDGLSGNELWFTDGTAAGTRLLADIQPGATGSRATTNPARQLTVSGSKVFFTANTTAEGNELWVIERVAAGPQLVTEIVAGSGSSGISVLTAFKGGVFFYANDGVNGVEAWFSDGTAAGTVSLGNLSPLATAGATNPTVVDDRIFFAVQVSNTPGVLGGELYVSDGTAASTTRVLADVQWPINTVGAVDGKAVFIANDGVSGSELWISDGTPSGTRLLKDIQPGGINSNGALAAGPGILFNGELYFRGTTTAEGAELWKTDGTEAGTVLVADINPGTGSSNVDFIFSTILNGRLYFRASTPGEGLELWSTDGTAAGTSRVADINPGTAGSTPTNFSVQVVPPPVVSISLAPATAEEGEAFTLTATRVGAVLSQPTTVSYTITGPAANAGDIATPLTGTITILANQTTATLTIATVEDTVVEADEPFTVTITNPVNGSIGTATATATILNDDAAALPVITLAVSPASVTENGVANLVYTFTRTGATTNPLTVNYAINGTATNGTDYALIPASVVFAAGSATATVTVDPTGDSILEPDETVSLTLVADPAYSIGTAGAVIGTITNDDAASFSISDVTLTEGNSGTATAVFTVTLSNAVAGGASVNFATADNTATAGSDYLATSGTLTFSGTAGEQRTVSVTINGDTEVEPNESFFLNLSSPTNGVTLADGQGIGTIANDDVGNRAPVFVADPAITIRPGQTATITGSSLLANDTDADGDSLSVAQFFTVTSQGGTVANTAFDTFTYTPPAGFTGTDTFAYVIADGAGGTANATLAINVVNGAPVAVADPAITIRPGQTATITGASLLANDTDPDGDSLTVAQFFTVTSQGGTVANTAFDTFTYTPPADFTGTDTFSYVIADGFGGFTNATLAINVVNGAPVAIADPAITIRPGQTATITGANLIANDTDPDGDPLSLAQFSIATSQGGTVANTAFDTFTYTPAAGFTGTDTFSYVIADSFGGFTNATLAINVVNGAPVFVADPAITIQPGQTATILGSSLLANDTDPDGDPLSLAQFFTVTSQGGSVANTAFDTFTYTPAAGFTGTDTFSYVITDSFGGTTNGTLAINVQAKPSVSVAVSPASVLENGASNLVYTFTRTGPTTNPLVVNYSIGGSATNGIDYGLIGTSITFSTGSATATLSVDPTGDSIVEPDETVVLTLLANDAYTVGTAGAVTGTITNDDLGRTITGTKNRDSLVGTAGDDVITGLQGADTIRGNGGADRFVYRSIVDAGDTIIDFNRAEGDKVDLKGALASVGYGGSTPITDGYLKFVANGGDTLLQIDPDGSGVAAARNFILFKNVSLASLSNPDNFIV